MLFPLVASLCTLGGCGSNPIDEVIADLTPPKPGEIAREAFDPTDADKRRRSVSLLSAAYFGGEEPYLRAYRLLIDDPDATVRAACVKALGYHGDVNDANKLIIPRLGDDNVFVRWEAAQALQKIHTTEAIEPLIKATGDEDADVRLAAADALGQFPRADVFQVLVSLLDDPEFSVAHAARESLSTLTGYDMGPDGGDWLLWSERNRDRLFVHQQRYTWEPYEPHRGWFEKAKFWKGYDKPQPLPPRGLEAQSDATPGDKS